MIILTIFVVVIDVLFAVAASVAIVTATCVRIDVISAGAIV